MSVRTIRTDTPTPVTLAHVVLRTAQLDAKIDFYEQLVGMRTNYRNASGAALSHDGEHHRIALMAVPPSEPNSLAPGLEHLAFKMRSLGELLGNYRRLKTAGLVPLVTIHHGGTLSAYYLDPDGLQVETFIDTQIADLSIEDMSSDRFAANPVGVPVDLDELTDRFVAGEPIAALLEQPPLREGQLDELVTTITSTRGPRSA
ncbi:VOC family protein [Mycolicibacterium hodleri]|uniref:Biphenyl 2,3-dioxygenase n=1 Tax=Mycolicibacterium hodleri TaxID=49897 RepID=A0A502EGA1_9MYCO|nr:VOC family protein [Mycolicibacterium hodleri]TPG36718.1 biphenyl 2,3-dioxygenase [Mycolicibacterium hodleri]